MEADTAAASGKIVAELTGVSHGYGGTPLLRDVDLVILRGDRVGLLGPNGAGKSTLLNIILGRLKPDAGQVKLGTRLQVAYFDQLRSQLDPSLTLDAYISEGREFIDIGGRRVHVMGYLGNFLFDREQARSPIRTLSGGEQNRLVLAKLFSLPSNLLVLDEPTNDLDVASLELLESLLAEYDGTVLLVSHDRAFMDNVVSSLLVFEGEARLTEYVGGYSDWLRETGGFTPAPQRERPGRDRVRGGGEGGRQSRDRTGERKRQRELEALPGRIEQLESDLAAKQEHVSDPAFFRQSADEQKVAYDELAAIERELARLYERWEELESS